jgi:hypothetical protein
MRGFSISESGKQLVGLYPDALLLSTVTPAIQPVEREGLVRLWLSEGIPYAFREIPLLYERIRSWLASRLKIHPKEVTVVGSARIGYSLAQPPNFGRPFGPHSDLDLTIISEPTFSHLVEDFERWKADLHEGSVGPETDAERRFWPENLRRLPANIGQGFVDPHLIPRRHRYPNAQLIGQVMFELKSKLDSTPEAPSIRKASIRVYRDWQAFIARAHLNLLHAIH